MAEWRERVCQDIAADQRGAIESIANSVNTLTALSSIVNSADPAAGRIRPPPR
jgi:hypothetical protein